MYQNPGEDGEGVRCPGLNGAKWPASGKQCSECSPNTLRTPAKHMTIHHGSRLQAV